MFNSLSSIYQRAVSLRRQATFAPAALLVFLLASLLISAGCRSEYPASAQQARPGAGGRGGGEARQVRTARVAELPMGRAVTVNGTLAAFEQATVSVKVPGRLQLIAVDLGSVVRRGQTIARVEARDYELRVQQSEAGLQQARARLGLAPNGASDQVNPEQTGTVRQASAQLHEARLNRQRAATLVEQGVISRAEFDSADASYRVAESRYQDAIEEIRNRQAVLAQRRSELALARQQLADTVVLAPFDGIVQERRAGTGEYLAAGAPLVTIVKMNPLRFRAEVPEREAANVRVGQNLRLAVEGAPSNYSGRVMRLSPIISAQSRVLLVEADVANDGALRPGAFAQAEIVTDDASMAITVPTSAVVSFAGIEKVIIVDNGRAAERPITTGRRTPEWTEVIAGVNVGDAVVLEPGNLQSGQPVSVIE